MTMKFGVTPTAAKMITSSTVEEIVHTVKRIDRLGMHTASFRYIQIAPSDDSIHDDKTDRIRRYTQSNLFSGIDPGGDPLNLP